VKAAEDWRVHTAPGFDLVDVAENAFGLLPPAPGAEVEDRGHVILVDSDGTSGARMALRCRFSPNEVDDRIDEVRAWFRERRRDDFTWWIGSAAPRGLTTRLRERGATDTDDPDVAAMVLERPPAAVAGVDVRHVTTVEEAMAAWALAERVFGLDPSQRAPDLEKTMAAQLALEFGRLYAAYVEDVLVGRGVCIATTVGPVTLVGGCVAEEARGRGVYRALVRVRWEWAAERGSPLLVTQAGRLSRPILERTGFRTVGRLRLLTDRTTVA
jgi:GNAT superfamily N-acetyltransferase